VGEDADSGAGRREANAGRPEANAGSVALGQTLAVSREIAEYADRRIVPTSRMYPGEHGR
jgi:hypothetical protein